MKILSRCRHRFFDCLFRVSPKPIIRAFLYRKQRPWIFVVSSTNAGSTLLQKLISNHPEVSYMHTEGQFVTRELRRDPDRLFGLNKDHFYLTEEDDGNYLRVHYDWYLEAQGSKNLVLEKTVSNAMRMRWLQKWFAPASFIVLVRSPYSVCEGIRRRTGASIEAAAQNWTAIYNTILEDAPRMKKILFVDYTELVNAPEEVLEKIRCFAPLVAQFEFDRGTHFSIMEKREVIRDMDGESLSRLSKEEIGIINFNCHPVMSKLGLRIA